MAKAELKIIGSSPARMGGVERVVGKGVYGIDLMLKDQLHGAPHRDLARQGARQVGQEVDARVLIQGNHRQVDGLGRPESPDARVAYHEVHVDVPLALHLFPLQMVGRATLVAPLGRRIMQPLTGGAVLQDQPPLVTGIPEGLGQIVGNRGRSFQAWDR